MHLLLAAALTVAAVPRKQSFVPAPEPALERPKAQAPAPSILHPDEERHVELMVHEKRLQMIRELEQIIWLER